MDIDQTLFNKPYVHACGRIFLVMSYYLCAEYSSMALYSYENKLELFMMNEGYNSSFLLPLEIVKPPGRGLYQ